MRVNAVLALLIPKLLANNFMRFVKRISLILILMMGWNWSSAQVAITQLGTPYTENFNSLSASNNAALPSGFRYGSDWPKSVTYNWVATTVATGSLTGTTNLSNGTGGFYNFANGDSAVSTERAIGFLTDGASYRSHRSIMFGFTNNTGATVTSLNISCNYEKYRNGNTTSPASWKVYHGNTTDSIIINTSPTTASSTSLLSMSSVTGIIPGMMIRTNSFMQTNTVVASINALKILISPSTSSILPLNTTVAFSSTANTLVDSTIYASDGNNNIISSPGSLSKNISISGLSIPNGTTYYIRWTYFSGNVSGGTGHALGIDDFTISLSDGNCAPSVQGKMDSITAVSSSQMTLNYTRGNGDSVLIVASTSSSLLSDPVNGTLYTANSTFGSGTALGGGFVVYKDVAGGRNSSNNTVTITGLNSSTPYYYYIYEFNKSGTGAGSCYKIPSATFSQNTSSASNDYYRSRQSTQWSDASTWESSNDSAKWVTASLKPTSVAKNILIKDSVTITAVESAKLLTIAFGAKLTYTTGTGYTGGYTLNIVDDGSSAFDFNIYGTYVVFGNPATLTSPATAKIFNTGIIRADANSGGLSDNFAFNPSVYFVNGSVFEWNTSTALNASGRTYFTFNNAQPQIDIPTFRLSKPLSNVGGTNPTTINGVLELNARLEFVGGGAKTFRNGRIGTGNLIQTVGTFSFTENAIWGGSGIDSLNVNYGLRISAGKTTTLVGNKTIQGGPLYIDGTLNLSNYDLTLASTPVATASLGKLGASGNINYSGTGRFVVDRYISTGTNASQHAKSWQFLATPTWGENQTINAAWQEGATSANQNRVSGYGTQITGLVGWTNGFDLNTSSPSMKSYDAATNSWIGVSRTDTTLYNKNGYMIFVRGDRSVTAYNQAAVPTILRSRGKLYDKSNLPPSINIAAGNLESVGNPYSSSIDFTTLLSEATSGSLNPVFYLWDPTLSTFGGWQTFSGAGSYLPSLPNTFYPNTSNNRIQSGQAFFVSSTLGCTVNFSENAKVTDNRLVNRAPVNINQLSMLSTSLSTIINNESKKVDGNRIVFDNSYSYNIDENDASKIINPSENLGINKHDTLIAVEARGLLNVNDTIFYNVSNLYQPNYQLLLAPQNIVSRGLVGLLVDKYLNTKTSISLTDSNFINFSINSDLASKASDRFMLVFQRANVSLPVRFLSINTSHNKENVPVINWSVDNEINIDRYELESSNDGLSFDKINTQSPSSSISSTKNYSYIDNKALSEQVFYRVKAISMDGMIQYSKIVSINTKVNTTPSIKIYPNPATSGNVQIEFKNAKLGFYSIEVNNMAGQLVYKENWTNKSGNEIKKINQTLTSGIYKIRVVNEVGEINTLRLIVNNP
jgi:hypothetical protein